MAGYFEIGEQKVRPGAYFNVQKRGNDNAFGAVDGVVAVLFKSDFGPLCRATELAAEDGYTAVFGDAGTTDAMREALYGGAVKLVACRVGNGGTAATTKLAAATGGVNLTAKYPGSKVFTVTVRKKLEDPSRKECIIYTGTQEFEKINFAAGENEVSSLVEAFGKSKNFTAEVTEDGTGIVTEVAQQEFTAGTDPEAETADYSNALEEIERYYFNTICVDTEDAAVHALVSAFLDRIYEAGQFGIAVVAEKAKDFEERLEAAAGYNKENMIYIINPSVSAGTEVLDGYQTAAMIAGMIAAHPSNQSLTHTVIERYTELGELLTNSQIIKAEQSGCLVLSRNSENEIWIDSAINTLVNPDEDHDEGWKKIRRVKTRYELLYRANAQADALVGKVDNDTNGRATITAKIQNICNTMVQEGKLTSATVAEADGYIADGDSCYFTIDVVDKDSAEHIYMFYRFQFSTISE